MVLITSYNYSYWGESKPTYNWGASHCKTPMQSTRFQDLWIFLRQLTGLEDIKTAKAAHNGRCWTLPLLELMVIFHVIYGI